jgi:hypothetical protein
MAKKFFKIPKHDSGKTVTTKTYFGSDSSMVVQDDDIIKGLNLTKEQVVCKDDVGYYITTTKHLDSGLADPNRYANKNSRLVLDK